jgi:hypothetical protein
MLVKQKEITMEQFEKNRIKMTNDIIHELYSAENMAVVKLGCLFLSKKMYDLSNYGVNPSCFYDTKDGTLYLHPEYIIDFLKGYWDKRMGYNLVGEIKIDENARLEIREIYKKYENKVRNI